MRSAKAGCRKNILPINRRAAFGSSPTRSQWRNVFDVTPVPPTISGNREGVSDRQGSPSCKWHRRLFPERCERIPGRPLSPREVQSEGM
jgi:hypothetical protein